MFKSVSWSGFESRSDLRRQVEERMPDIEAELGRLAGEVDIELAMRDGQPDGPYLSLTLGLSIGGQIVSQHGLISAEWLQEPHRFRRVVRAVWGVVLDRQLEHIARRVKRDLVESVGV